MSDPIRAMFFDLGGALFGDLEVTRVHVGEVFEYALRRAGCSPEDVISVGDSRAHDVAWLEARGQGLGPLTASR